MFTDTTSAGYGATALDHLSASAFSPCGETTAEADDIADRIALATLAEIDDIVRDMRLDHAGGRISVDDLDALEEAARTRRAAITETARAARKRARRCLHQPAPGISPETRKRIKLWRTQAREKLKAGEIGDGELQYADILFGLRTVRAGEGSMASDKTMGGWLEKSEETARRRRRRLAKAGLVEAGGCGKDGKSCVVVPVLQDGTAVFAGPGMPTGAGTSDRGGWSKVTTDSFTDSGTELPPLPPVAEPAPVVPPVGEGSGPSIEGGQEAQPPEPAEPPQGAADGAVQAKPPARLASAEAARLDDEGFLKVWRATGRVGREGYAITQWAGLSPIDKAEALECTGHPDFRAPDMWGGKWLELRLWRRPAPIRPAEAPVAPRREAPVPSTPAPTPEERAQVAAKLKAYLGRS